MKGPVLILTNGYGEDLMGAMIGRALAGRHGLEVLGFPLVGPGVAFDRAGIGKAHASLPLPSGGYVLRDISWRPGTWRNLLRDLGAGIGADLRQQRRALRSLRGKVGYVLAVGDFYPALVARLWLGSRAGLVQTAKTVLATRFGRAELAVMRRCCRLVMARDEETAAFLQARGLRAVAVGNPMMDAVTYGELPVDKEEGERWVAVFPGSREGVDANLRTILRAVPTVRSHAEREGRDLPPVRWIVAWPPTQGIDLVVDVFRSEGWRLASPDGSASGDEGAALYLNHPSGVAAVVVRRGVGDLLREAHVAVGVAGTVHEQAGGHGVPVVTFPGVVAGRPADRFIRKQKRFLGEGMAVVAARPESIGEALARILTDDALRARMSADARRRIGRAGAVDRVVELVAEELGL